MNNTFKPYTIIPNALYVERAADRKIEDIITAGGRPGYVLVSRQMGKTNLLLHAKEKLETKSHIFTYVDLSNRFQDERSCFRNIIDTTIETHEDVLGDTLLEIYEKREQTSSLPPHKEHERELRFILGIVDKLVIILDEVDALTNTTYSDRIFAQIRSIYFSRKNFPEYYNLTYVLSGVAEPVDIIKDKDISPFNIGEKIFLDDFTRSEFDTFVSRSSRAFSDEVKDRIFHWTGGNPRMSWEISSKVELLLIDNLSVNPGKVDEIVKEIFLDKNDIPPVDHIKELLIGDVKLRNCVVELHYGKGKSLSSYEKSRLFLSGIIGSDFSKPKIKNEILLNLITLEWISTIEKSAKGLYDEGFTSLRMGRFEEAIVYFEKYLDDSKDIQSEEKASTYMHLASCNYKIRNYEKALFYYQGSLLPKEGYKNVYLDNIYHQGLCFLALNEFEKAIPLFEEVVNDERVSLESYRAKLNLAGCYYYLDYGANKETIKRLNLELKEDLEASSIGLKEEEFKEVIVNVLFNLGRIYQLQNLNAEAEEYFQQAVTVASIIEQPIVYYNLSLLKEGDEKEAFLNKATSLIMTNDLLPLEVNVESPLYFNRNVLSGILIDLLSVSEYSFGHFLNYTLKNIYGSKIHAKQLLRDLANEAEEEDHVTSAASILAYNLKMNVSEMDIVEKHHHYKFLSVFDKTNERAKYFEKYFQLLKTNFSKLKVDEVDFRVMTETISENISKKKFDEARTKIDFIRTLKLNVPERIQPNYILIDILEINLLNSLNKKDEVLLKANVTLDKLKSFKVSNSSYMLSESLINSLKGHLLQVIKTHVFNGSDRKKIGRNIYVEVKYLHSGNTKILKHKRVHQDIQRGLCQVVRIVEK